MHNNDMEIEFDPDKARSNFRKHRVSFADAEQSLRDERAITVTDPDAEDESRFVTLGMDALGRVLVVVHTPRGDRIRIISARKASLRSVGGRNTSGCGCVLLASFSAHFR